MRHPTLSNLAQNIYMLHINTGEKEVTLRGITGYPQEFTTSHVVMEVGRKEDENGEPIYGEHVNVPYDIDELVALSIDMVTVEDITAYEVANDILIEIKKPIRVCYLHKLYHIVSFGETTVTIARGDDEIAVKFTDEEYKNLLFKVLCARVDW